MRLKRRTLRAISALASANPVYLLCVVAGMIIGVPIATIGLRMAADVARAMFAGAL